MRETKTCSSCKKQLPISSFYDRKETRTLSSGQKKTTIRKQYCCKKCQTKRWNENNYKKEDKRIDRLNDLDKAITSDDGFNKMLEEFGL